MGKSSELDRYRELVSELSAKITKLKGQNNTLAGMVKALRNTLASADPEGLHPIINTQGSEAKTVIIIDDTYLMHVQYKEVLEDLGLAVIADSSNGEFGKNLVISLEPDLVLLDYEMPIMDGLETTQLIRKGGNIHSKIVIVSATLSIERVDNLLKAGANEFLAKPLDAERLQTALKNMGF